MLPKPQWWINLLSFTSVSLACISLIFGYTVLTQSFPGGCDDLASALLLLLDPILCWSYVWLQSQEGQDTDLAEKLLKGKKKMVLCSGSKGHTNHYIGKMKEILQQQHMGERQFPGSLHWMPLFSDIHFSELNRKTLTKAPLSFLDPCGFLFITHIAISLLSTPQMQSLRAVFLIFLSL